MRLRAAAPAVLVVALLVPTSPARAATVSVANFRYAPSTIRVAPGDTVSWSWAGPDTNHSVTADPGQAESFDSEGGVATPLIDHPVGFTFSHTFTRAGSFTYFCQVHTFMRGRVDVGTSSGDTTSPAITRLRARPTRARRSTKLIFKLSENATSS
jgi:plastocyanin